MTAFVDVTVVPVSDRLPEVLEHHTVVVRDGVIARIGPVQEVQVPGGARVVAGEGRWLAPGLADMHVHLQPGAGERGDPAWRQLALLVANGVTTARSLAGAPGGLGLRERVRRGEVTGPRLYLAGPSFHTGSVATPEAARLQVRRQAEEGYDLLKTHGVSSEVYDALVDAARAAGMPLVGHVVPAYGLDRALAAGQQIEHLDGYLHALVPADVPAPPGQFVFGDALDALDTARIDDLVRATVDAGVWNSPTLALFEVVASGDGGDAYAAWPEMRYATPSEVEAWRDQKDQQAAAPLPPAQRTRFEDVRRRIARGLHEGGAPLLAGSDSPQFFMVSGFALHRELAALAAAGIPPADVLGIATRNAAEWFGPSADWGRVEEGMAADLVLLGGNPLEDVSALAHPDGVMVRGRWLDRDALDALLAAVETAAAG